MQGILLGFALKSGFWIPSANTAAVSLGFARSVRSRVAWAMAVGSLGTVVTSVVGAGVAAYLGAREFQVIGQGIASYWAAAMLQGVVATGFSVVEVLFALTFSVSLLFVLRDATWLMLEGPGHVVPAAAEATTPA